MDKKKSLKDRIIENILFSETTAFISKIGALVFTIIVARIFLPELFGVYSLALTIVLTMLLLSDLGIGSTITRYLSESIGKSKRTEVRSRFLFLFKTKLFLSLAVSILLFLFAGLISGFFNKPELILPLKIGSVYLFLNALYNLSTSVFIAFQKVKYSAIGEAIFQISKIILLLVSLLFFRSIESVFIVLSLSLIFSLGFSAGVIAKKYPFLLKGKKLPVERGRMIKFSGFLAMSSITLLIFSNMDKLVLGYFLDFKFVGFYNAMFSIVAGVLGLLSVMGVLLPIFTQLKGKDLERVFKKTFNYISLIAFPASIGLAFIMVPLLKILYGIEYVPLEYETSILLSSVFLSLIILEATLSSTYRVLLNAKEKPNIPALTNLGTSILNLGLNIVLVYYLVKINPSYGLVGASLATFASRYAGMFIMIFLSAKKINIFPEKNSITKPFFASLVMLGYLFLFTFLFPLNLVTGVLMIITAAILYFALVIKLKVISLNEVKDLLKSFYKIKS